MVILRYMPRILDLDKSSLEILYILDFPRHSCSYLGTVRSLRFKPVTSLAKSQDTSTLPRSSLVSSLNKNKFITKLKSQHKVLCYRLNTLLIFTETCYLNALLYKTVH